MARSKNQALELLEIKEQVRKFIYKAQYKKAIQYLKIWKKKYPEELFILATLATLPYEEDLAQHGVRRDRAFRKAAKNLLPLLRKLRGASFEDRMRHRNEYYWFSQQHKKQYELGLEGVRKGLKRSYYSQGVGAANLAYKLLLKGQSKRGLVWAKVAEKAWLNYFKMWSRTYHDPWGWYALAIGLQGRKKEMETALRRSAKLAQIPITDQYLEEVRDMVKQCERKAP